MNNAVQFQTIKILLEETQLTEIKRIISEIITNEVKNSIDYQHSPYLNKKQACNYLGISNNTLDSWIRQGLPTIKIGNTIRFHANELDNWLHTQH